MLLGKYLIPYKGLELVSSLNKWAKDELEICAIMGDFILILPKILKKQSQV